MSPSSSLRGLLRRRWTALIATLAVGMLLGASIVVAAVPSSPGPFTGCLGVKTNKGLVYNVANSTTTPTVACNKGDEQIVFSNAQGPQGGKGDTGQQGPDGAKGDTGQQGPEGPVTLAGLRGTPCWKPDVAAEGFVAIITSGRDDVITFACDRTPVRFTMVADAGETGRITRAIGDSVLFGLEITNNGKSDLEDVVISDLLPQGLALDGAGWPRDTDFDLATGVWTIGAVAPGATLSMRIHATVTTIDDVIPSRIVNVATMTASNAEAEEDSITIDVTSD